MKKKFLIAVLCVVVAAGFGLAGCGGSSDSGSKDEATTPPAAEEATTSGSAADAGTDSGDAPLVGISVPNNPTGWVGAVQWAAQNKATELGLNFQIATSQNPNEQADKIDQLITAGCKYIVLFPENDELAVAAQKIKDAGITLVDFDRTLGTTEPDYYVAGNNKEMGTIGAKYIIEKLEGKGGNVAIMNIPNYGKIFDERVDGAKEVFDADDTIKVIDEWASDNGAPETVLPIMKDILAANKKIDAIYSTDDEMSIGILQAIKEAGRTDIKVITGGGGSQDYFKIMNDYPDIWVSSQTYAPYMMNDCLEIVKKLIDGETVDAKTIIPPVNVDRTSYQKYLDDNGITADAPY